MPELSLVTKGTTKACGKAHHCEKNIGKPDHCLQVH